MLKFSRTFANIHFHFLAILLSQTS